MNAERGVRLSAMVDRPRSRSEPMPPSGGASVASADLPSPPARPSMRPEPHPGDPHMTETTTACIGCATSRERGRTTCFWCGNALGYGREPSDSERFETSPEGRMARVERSMSARREPDEIDACVAEAIARTLRAGAQFTHEDLVTDTGLNGCAIKYSLERLQRTGLVRAAGRIQVRSQRYRTIWLV